MSRYIIAAALSLAFLGAASAQQSNQPEPTQRGLLRMIQNGIGREIQDSVTIERLKDELAAATKRAEAAEAKLSEAKTSTPP